MRQTFDDYTETCQPIDGSTNIHPHNLGLLMLRGISSTGPFGQAKQCVINAFDTDYLMSADEVMANILHLAHNMDEEASASGTPAPDTSPPPIFAFVAVGRGSHGGRGHNPRHHVALVVVVASPTSAAPWQPRPYIVLLHYPR
jgi:hypothetical protein